MFGTIETQPNFPLLTSCSQPAFSFLLCLFLLLKAWQVSGVHHARMSSHGTWLRPKPWVHPAFWQLTAQSSCCFQTQASQAGSQLASQWPLYSCQKCFWLLGLWAPCILAMPGGELRRFAGPWSAVCLLDSHAARQRSPCSMWEQKTSTRVILREFQNT